MIRVMVRYAMACLPLALAAQTFAQGIFTCTGSDGRKITSDRPIAECLSKEQKELNPSGSVRRIVKPTLTAEEQRIAEQKQQEEAQERARQDEERRRNRALLLRYPNKLAHDNERNVNLERVDQVIATGKKRLTDLAAQRKKIDEELEFYRKDLSRMPPALRRQMEDNERGVEAAQRFIRDQDEEKKRVNARFDSELDRLRTLWAQAATAPAAGGASSAAATASTATVAK